MGFITILRCKKDACIKFHRNTGKHGIYPYRIRIYKLCYVARTKKEGGCLIAFPEIMISGDGSRKSMTERFKHRVCDNILDPHIPCEFDILKKALEIFNAIRNYYG